MSAIFAIAEFKAQLQSFLASDSSYQQLDAFGYTGTVTKRTDGAFSRELGLGNVPYIVLSLYNAKTAGFEQDVSEMFYNLVSPQFRLAVIYPMMSNQINNWRLYVDDDGVCYSYRLSDEVIST